MQRYCRSHLVPHTSTVKSRIGSSITNVDFGLFRPNKIPEFHEVKIQQQSNLVTSYTKHYCIQATSRSSLKGQTWQSPPMIDTRSISNQPLQPLADVWKSRCHWMSRRQHRIFSKDSLILLDGWNFDLQRSRPQYRTKEPRDCFMTRFFFW